MNDFMMNGLFIFLVPFLMMIVKVEGLPTLILSVLQHYVCKNKPKYKKVIPIITGCLSIILYIAFLSFMFLVTDINLLELSQKVLFVVVSFIFVILPLFVILLVTYFTKNKMIQFDEMQKMKNK